MSDLIMQLAGVIQRDINGFNEIANNVANANTVGFKSARSFSALAPHQSLHGVNEGFDAVVSRTYTNPAGGALQASGNVTDLALSGDAWFVLQTPEGARLTRDGRFRVGEDGFLVSEQGYRLMGKNGPIAVPAGELRVDSAGVVYVDGNEAGQITVMHARDAQALQSMGRGLYVSALPLQPAKNYSVHQGMRELSNSGMGNDMVRMMEATRHIETMQRALSAYDGMLDNGINRLGRE